MLHGLIRRLFIKIYNCSSSTFLADSIRCKRKKDLVIRENWEDWDANGDWFGNTMISSENKNYLNFESEWIITDYPTKHKCVVDQC